MIASDEQLQQREAAARARFCFASTQHSAAACPADRHPPCYHMRESPHENTITRSAELFKGSSPPRPGNVAVCRDLARPSGLRRCAGADGGRPANAARSALRQRCCSCHPLSPRGGRAFRRRLARSGHVDLSRRNRWHWSPGGWRRRAMSASSPGPKAPRLYFSDQPQQLTRQPGLGHRRGNAKLIGAVIGGESDRYL